MSMKRQLFDALEAQLVAALPWAKTISWQKIKILAGDFPEWELPAVQFYHLHTDYNHSQGRIEGDMRLVIEVVTKSGTAGSVDQRTLFDLMEDIELAVGANPNLGIPGVYHCKYISDDCDIHAIEPFHVGALTFGVLHRKGFSGC
jgi:hypothetical protein